MSTVLFVYLLLGVLALAVLMGVELVGETVGLLLGSLWVVALWPIFIGGRAGRLVAAAWANRD